MGFKLHNYDGDDDLPRGRGDGTVGGWRSRWPASLVENWDNPLGWSVKVGRAFGIDVRIHLITVVYMLMQVLSSIADFSARGWLSLGISTLTMLSLFLIVLVHEFGHCFACRWVGGSAERIVMLPFGGLALVQPPDTWRANLITTIGGPAVHVLLLPIFAGAMLLLGMGDQLVFNPFMPGAGAAAIQSSSDWMTLGLITLFWAYYINIVLFVFNVFLPMFPMDGGRIVQATLWRTLGYKRSMEIAVNVGLIGAVGLGVFAVVWSQSMLTAIAIFAGLTCWMERQRVKAIDELTGYVPIDPIAGLATGRSGSGRGGGTSVGARKRAERDAKEQAEMDRILEKISREGMGSITRSERKLLDRMSKTRRGV